MPSKPQSVIVERWLPYNDKLKRKVLFQRAPSDPIIVKPRNVIIQWEAPNVAVKKEFKYLGIIKANPVEYVQRYGPTLKTTTDLPQYVLDAKHPDGIVLAAESRIKDPIYELEGDVDALRKINQMDKDFLDREGLSEYKPYLNKNTTASTIVNSTGNLKTSLVESIETELEKIFKIIDTNNTGHINVNEATRIILRLISRLGIKRSINVVDEYLKNLVKSSEKTISFEQFKQAFFYLQE